MPRGVILLPMRHTWLIFAGGIVVAAAVAAMTLPWVGRGTAVNEGQVLPKPSELTAFGEDPGQEPVRVTMPRGVVSRRGLRPLRSELVGTTGTVPGRGTMFSLSRTRYGSNMGTVVAPNATGPARSVLLEVWESTVDLQEPRLRLRGGYPHPNRPQGPTYLEALVWLEASKSLWLCSSALTWGTTETRDDRKLQITAMKIELEGVPELPGTLGQPPFFEWPDWPLLPIPDERFEVERTIGRGYLTPTKMSAVPHGSGLLVFLAGGGQSRAFRFLPQAETGKRWAEVDVVPR